MPATSPYWLRSPSPWLRLGRGAPDGATAPRVGVGRGSTSRGAIAPFGVPGRRARGRRTRPRLVGPAAAAAVRPVSALHGHPLEGDAVGIVHLFGAYNAIAIADPSRDHVAAARRFAIGTERYWNPDLRPVPGYSRTPPGKAGRTWYDDEGWWGVAQFDAYRATHDRRFLADAARSLRFINSGWDPVAGGIWWNDLHAFKASESLAGGTLTAAGLFEVTHRRGYLALAHKYIAWADRTIRAPTASTAPARARASDALRRGPDGRGVPAPAAPPPFSPQWRAPAASDRRAFPVLTMGPQFERSTSVPAAAYRSIITRAGTGSPPRRRRGAAPCRTAGRAVPAHLGRPADPRARHAVGQAADARRDDERAGLARGRRAR